MTTSGNGKIIKRKNKSGLAYTFSIVRNYRNPMSGKATYETLAYIGSVRESEIPQVCEAFWQTVEEKLAELIKRNRIWKNDADKIRRQFDAVIPKPPVKATKVTTESSTEAIRAALAERGITL